MDRLFAALSLLLLLSGVNAWTRNIGVTNPTAPVIVGELVIVAANDTVEGSMLASGVLVWSATLDEPVNDLNVAALSVAVSSAGSAIVVTGTSSIKGLNASSGVVLWTLDVLSSLSSCAVCVERSSLCVVTTTAGMLVAFDGVTGGTLWKSSSNVGTTFAVTGDVVSTTMDGCSAPYIAYRISTGTKLWSSSLFERRRAEAARSVGECLGSAILPSLWGPVTAFYGSYMPNEGSSFTVLDAETGSATVSFNYGGAEDGLGGISNSAKVLAFVDSDGYITAINRDATQLWSHTNALYQTSTMMAGGSIVVGAGASGNSKSAFFEGINATSGAKLWTHLTPCPSATVVGILAISSGAVFYSLATGEIGCVAC